MSSPVLKKQPPPLPSSLTALPPPLPPPPLLERPRDFPAPPLVLVPDAPPKPPAGNLVIISTRVQRVVNTVSTRLRVVSPRELLRELRQSGRIGQLDPVRLNKAVVSLYKLVGFVVLSVIVLALVSYLLSSLFYWGSTSWLTPTVIARTDDHVLALASTLAVQASARDKLVADVADADRVVAMQTRFLEEARRSIADELRDRQSELNQLLALRDRMDSARAAVHRDSGLYSDLSRARLNAERKAHLIDRDGAVTGAMQLSQIAAGNLSLAEKGVALETRVDELVRQTSSLQALVQKTPAQHHSYEVLKMLADVQRAELELAKARDYREALGKSLARYQDMVGTIEGSAYLRAAQQKAAIALVPYDNLAKVKPDAPLYSCSLGLLWCRRVGRVVAVLPGEMQLKHPLHNVQLRGQAVQLELTDPKLAEKPVLFAGGRPLLF